MYLWFCLTVWIYFEYFHTSYQFNVPTSFYDAPFVSATHTAGLSWLQTWIWSCSSASTGFHQEGTAPVLQVPRIKQESEQPADTQTQPLVSVGIRDCKDKNIVILRMVIGDGAAVARFHQ